MDRPFTPYELDLAIRDSSHGAASGLDAILNEFLQHLGPAARGTLRTMINICLSDGCVPMSWKIGETIPVPKFGKDPCRAESHRPIALLSALLEVTEKMVHRRLSALLPHHPRQFGFVSSRRTSDVVTLVLDRITRGLNEFSMVEYERPSGGAPSLHPRRHRSLVVLIDFSTAFDTIDHGKLLVMLDRLPRLGPRTKRWLRNYLRGRYVRVRVREQTSRLQLTSAGVPQGSVLGPQLFLYYVDDLLRRLDNIYSASAFMYADDLTLVASGADIHACAAAMQPALSLVTSWAAEHNLKINVDKSEAALFCVSSHTLSDEDPVALRLGNGNLQIKSHPVRLLGTTIDRLLNFGPHAAAAAKQTMLRRYQLRLVAQAGASHHTMRSFLIGYVHSVLLYSGEAIAPCLAPTYLHNMEVRYRDSCKTSLGLSASTEDTSVYLEANLLPLRKVLWLRALSQHERYTRLRNSEDLRAAIYSEPAPPSLGRKAATAIPLPRDAVLNELRRVCSLIGISPEHARAPLVGHRITPWCTESCHKVCFFVPKFAKDAEDHVRRHAFETVYASLEPHELELWTDGSSSLPDLTSGSAALLYDVTRSDATPADVHRAAAGKLACSYRAECLAIENGFRHLLVPRLTATQTPTRVLVATDSLSAIEALRVDPLAAHDYATEEIWIMLLSLVE
ncbi:uncharacterized protein Tco025E_10231, partial [Trypanosoma conorhini]